MHAHRALPLHRGRFLLALALAIAAIPRSARAAPSISVQDPIIVRAPAAGPDMRAVDASTDYFISRADCVNDLVFHFPVSTSGPPAGLRVFATATGDCLTPRGRATGTGPGACWSVPLRHPSATGTVDVHAHDLVTHVLGLDCDGMPVGDAPRPEARPLPGPQAVTLYFMQNPGGVDFSASPDAYFRWTRTSIEVVGPPPPEPRLGFGDGELLVALPPATDRSMAGYYVFCYPLDIAFRPPGAPPASPPFATGVPGASPPFASGIGPDQCPPGTASLVDRTSPDTGSPFVCASRIPASAGIVRITALHDGSPLEDGRGYVVAVAAYDDVDNVGPLSPLLCGGPRPTTTFMKAYFADGGEGCQGCGICNVGAPSGLPWPPLSAAALAAAGVVVRRGRRRR